jgi:RNA polymerase sigma factor (sigma-70 family)
MSPTELERPLQADALREIERSLYGKLKAYRLSDSFVERCGEDAVQKGWIEYLRAVEEGVEVDNRDAFIVQAAFRRAVDELRREARQSDGAAVEAILESGRLAAPPSEELAVERLAAEELYEAIETLPAEERQALSLHYFEQLSDRRSAEVLYCSERTFRRRLAKALSDLGHRLGVPAPEPGSELAIEIGLAAWAGLRGANVALSHGLLEQLATVADAARQAATWAVDRIRDLTARLFAGGASERIAEIAGGPAGRAGGACTGALALCVLTGVVGPGAGGVDVIGSHDRPQRPKMAQQSSSRPRSPTSARSEAPRPVATDGAGPTRARSGTRRTSTAGRRRREARQVKAQTDGLARAGSESTTAPTSPAVPVSTSRAKEPTETSSAPSGGGSSTTGASEEEAQAKQQFGAFK